MEILSMSSDESPRHTQASARSLRGDRGPGLGVCKEGEEERVHGKA